jgi:bacteriocin-like protein
MPALMVAAWRSQVAQTKETDMANAKPTASQQKKISATREKPGVAIKKDKIELSDDDLKKVTGGAVDIFGPNKG